MESLIGLVNRIQRACTMLGDYGGGDNSFSSLWEALPSVAVVGGQVLFLIWTLFNYLFFFFFERKKWIVYSLSITHYLGVGNDNRVLASLQCWRVLLGVTFFLEAQVCPQKKNVSILYWVVFLVFFFVAHN